MQPKKNIIAGLSLGIAAVTLGAFAFVHPAAAQSPFPPAGSASRPTPFPNGGQERHPSIRRAIAVIERVKDSLQRDPHDFDGHRLAAIQDLDRAESELHQAIASDRH